MNLIKLIFILVPLLLTACVPSKSSWGNLLTPTIYYKPTVKQDKSRCGGNFLRDLLSVDGHILATLCEEDYRECLLQGSCFVDEAGTTRSYNYHSLKEGVPRFVEMDLHTCPFGYGVRNNCLDPYFSVAADLSIYKLGDVIFIPRLIGAVMPNGETHDGFVIVRDAGGKILGEGRFDFFTGFFNHLAKENTLARLGFGDPANRFEYRLATAEETVAVHERRQYPGLKTRVLQEGTP